MAASVTMAKVGAGMSNKPLFAYLQEKFRFGSATEIPRIAFNILSGGTDETIRMPFKSLAVIIRGRGTVQASVGAARSIYSSVKANETTTANDGGILASFTTGQGIFDRIKAPANRLNILYDTFLDARLRVRRYQGAQYFVSFVGFEHQIFRRQDLVLL